MRVGEIAGVNGQNSEGMCQGGKPGTGKLYTDVCLCCSAHTSGCVVDGLGATAAFCVHSAYGYVCMHVEIYIT